LIFLGIAFSNLVHIFSQIYLLFIVYTIMKKILCLFSALLITLANIPAGIFAANDSYSPELQDAYQFAFQNNITTMDSIDKADMNG
jgi:hypothetical protein